MLGRPRLNRVIAAAAVALNLVGIGVIAVLTVMTISNVYAGRWGR